MPTSEGAASRTPSEGNCSERHGQISNDYGLAKAGDVGSLEVLVKPPCRWQHLSLKFGAWV